jgi:hypothetical protein
MRRTAIDINVFLVIKDILVHGGAGAVGGEDSARKRRIGTSTFGATNSPATITATDVNMCVVVFMLLLYLVGFAQGVWWRAAVTTPGEALSYPIKGTAKEVPKKPRDLLNDHDPD